VTPTNTGRMKKKRQKEAVQENGEKDVGRVGAQKGSEKNAIEVGGCRRERKRQRG